jgi:hypothetical protein
MECDGSLPCWQVPTNSVALCNIFNKLFLHSEGMLAPSPTPKLVDHI